MTTARESAALARERTGNRRPARDAVEWVDEIGRPTSFPDAVAAMEAQVAAIRAGQAYERIWLVEHPPLYTAGTSARPQDLLDSNRFPVFRAGRGGQYTYHGPGQIVAYVMLDLARRNHDVRRFVRDLEEWLIVTLARFGVRGERREGRVGIWVDRGPDGRGGRREDKIAAIGVRVRRWVSFHGIALNVEPDLAHFEGIVPCGITGFGVTSLVDLGIPATMDKVLGALRPAFGQVFGRETGTGGAAA
jgi:lipoyl(octanoyl) transferase